MFDWPLLSCTNRGLFCPQPAIIHDSASKIVAHQIVDSLSPQSQGTIYRNENTYTDCCNQMLALYERLPERQQILLIGRLQEMVEPLASPIEKDIAIASDGEAI